jgi:alpha/beta hydrolase fold/Activator of Hsp90 ATPase homolog 1-like protein
MPDVTAPHPTADLHLRGTAPIRVTWPAAALAPPPLVVHLGPEPRIDLAAIVLAVSGFEDALRALEWCADHGAELGGDPRRLILAGDGSAAGLVAALARHARDRGWPPIERTVLTSHRGGPMTMTQSYFAINRRVAAPRELVFQAWTDPELVRRWYRGDPLEYREVEAPARIVFTTGGPDLEIVTLSIAGDHTVMTFEGSAPQAERDWSAMLDALAATVAQGSQAGGNAGGIRPG